MPDADMQAMDSQLDVLAALAADFTVAAASTEAADIGKRKLVGIRNRRWA
jgi:hypothetical protein